MKKKLNNSLLDEIKDLVKKVDSSATIILFGSSAKGNSNKHSDIDLLILIDKEKLTYLDEREIKNPLYDLEFQTGKIISPLVLSKKNWENEHSKTPFYNNVMLEGIQI